MSALVAGGAGFVGSHLCDWLVSQNQRVIVVDCCVTGRRQNIEHLLDKITWIEADISSPYSQWLSRELQSEITEIYNLASPASPVDFDKMPVFILRTAAHGHENLLELARQNQARILMASTSEIYGDPLVHPQPESYFGNVNSIGPRSCYDEAKRYAEALSMAYARAHGVDARIARIFNTYGPRMRPTDGRVICNFFSQALRKEPLTIYGTGSQTRSFCYVSDLVQGLYKLMKSDVKEPVNLGNPIEKTVLEMADTVCKLTGHDMRHRFLPAMPDDPQKRKPDISRAIQLLQWRPQVSLERGLKETLEYFQASFAL